MQTEFSSKAIFNLFWAMAFLLFSNLAGAQQWNNWTFGQGGGLDFNYEPPRKFA